MCRPKWRQFIDSLSAAFQIFLDAFTSEMFLAEFLNALAGFGDHLLWNRQHNAEVGWEEEARKAGESLNRLLSRQRLCELKASLNVREAFEINANHHVHRTLWHDRIEARRIFENVVGRLSGILKAKHSFINYAFTLR